MPEPALTEIMNDVLTTISGYFSPSAGGVPDTSASFLSVEQKSPAIGSRIHTDVRAGFPIAAIKAGHLNANVQIQIWDPNPGDIELKMTDLQGRILADKEILRAQGFIKLKNTETSVSELVTALNAWRKTSQFNVLYEYQYQDSDGAESIIHRIPITNDLEEVNTPHQENTVVTDAMQRWDNEQAHHLTVSGTTHTQVLGIHVLAYQPGGWLGNSVIVRRFTADTTNPPNVYPSLSDFIAAVTDPVSPDTNAQVSLASFSDFVGALDIVGATFPLGDWEPDATPDQYQAYQLLFDKPLLLSRPNDLFEISYQAATIDSTAVVYLRAKVT